METLFLGASGSDYFVEKSNRKKITDCRRRLTEDDSLVIEKRASMVLIKRSIEAPGRPFERQP
jgi:hypothetical protein